jgi:hypothetical protein
MFLRTGCSGSRTTAHSHTYYRERSASATVEIIAIGFKGSTHLYKESRYSWLQRHSCFPGRSNTVAQAFPELRKSLQAGNDVTSDPASQVQLVEIVCAAQLCNNDATRMQGFIVPCDYMVRGKRYQKGSVGLIAVR